MLTADISRAVGLCRGPKYVLGTDRAAGLEISEAVPVGETWLLQLVAFTLAQGITQTPLPDIVVDDGTGANIIYQGPCASSAQNASVTARYFVGQDLLLGAGGAATRINSPLPSGLLLPSGSRIRTLTAGIGANSDFGPPLFLVIKYGG